MTKSKSVESARKRLREEFPYGFSQCLPEASLYGKCVAQHLAGDLKVNDCAVEFERLKVCFKQAKSKIKK